MKSINNDVIRHYDLLIEENNDPVRDPKPLKDYMDKWDELVIEDKMTVVDALISVIKATETDIEIIWKI